MGELSGPPEKFLLPQELLTKRSWKFREILLERSKEEGSPGDIRLSETTVQTMKDFFVWTFSPQPQIDERATFGEISQLGIFAWRYQISALSNQVTDMIRSNIANGEWDLQPSIVNDIYEAAPAGSPLREVIRAALGRLPRSSVDGEGQAWRATFLKHAQLGWDYIEAGGTEWTTQEYLSGVCRFHDHQGVSHHEKLVASCDGCPYTHEDCYPTWEQETINGFDHEEEAGEPETDMTQKVVQLCIDADAGEGERSVVPEAAVHHVNGALVSDEASNDIDGTLALEEVGHKANGELSLGEPLDESNGTLVSEPMTDEANETVPSESLAEDVEEPVTIEAIEIITGEKLSESGAEKLPAEGVVSPKPTGKKGKKKNRRGSVHP